MSYAWSSLERDYAGLARGERITLLTCAGTAVSMWDGFPAETARALGDEQFLFQPIYYGTNGIPDAFPMLPSRRSGEAELRRQIHQHPGRIAILGYSQGAMVAAATARAMLDPADDLHGRLKDLTCVITWGDPMRAPNVARGNEFVGEPVPKELDGFVTGGIAGLENLTPEQTDQLNLISFAHDLDLYSSAPVGLDMAHLPEVGHIENTIYQVIQEVTVADVWEVVKIVAEAIFCPFAILVPLVQAIFNAGQFFLAGMNSPHYTYTIDGAVKYLQQTAATTLAA
jgi:hypothetical protein